MYIYIYIFPSLREKAHPDNEKPRTVVQFWLREVKRLCVLSTVVEKCEKTQGSDRGRREGRRPSGEGREGFTPLTLNE